MGNKNMRRVINLLPDEFKKKLDTVMYIKVVLFISIILGLLAGIFAGRYFIAKKELQKANDEYAVVQQTQSKIQSLKMSIDQNQSKVVITDETFFAFDTFMKAIYSYKPASVTLISLDSQDRLTDTSTNGSVGNTSDTTTNTETATSEPATAAKAAANANAAAVEASAVPSSGVDGSGVDGVNGSMLPDGYVATSGVTNTPLTDKLIYLRGFSESADDIANYIYKISYLECVKDVQLTSIEERKDTDGNPTKVFEIIITTKK